MLARRSCITVFLALATAASSAGQCETDFLLASSPQSDAWFGNSIAADADVLVAGAPYHAVAGQIDAGSATVFRNVAGQWVEEVVLVRAAPGFGDELGTAVALQGDRALVGVPGFGPTDGGRVFVYERAGGAWSQVAKLKAMDTFHGRHLGSAVALDGNVVVAGGPDSSELGYLSGSAHVFELSGGVWSEVAKLLPEIGGTHLAHFGKAVAVDGDTIVVGAPRSGEWGAVFIYRRGTSGWMLEAHLERQGIQREFGQALALEGDRLLVGAGDWVATGPGRAFVFERTGTTWNEVDVLEPPEVGSGWHSFGAAVTLEGDRALVGAPIVGDDGSVTTGAIALYEAGPGGWEHRWTHRPDASEVALSGASVALQNGTAFASAPGTTVAGLLSAGAILALDPDAGAQPYCTAAANSAGAGAHLGWFGHPSLAAADFGLTVTGAVPGQPGLFFYGDATAQIPVGDGILCVGGSTYRLEPPVIADSAGAASYALDFTQPPVGSGPGEILAGSTWHFQLWYRDPAAGGAGFNFSDGLAATFCD